MKKAPPDVYKSLAHRLRHRIEFAEQLLGSNAPQWQIVEAVALQGRKSIETIAHMSLVATEHGLGKLGVPKDAKKHWNAEVIFRSLRDKKLNILPSPSRMEKSADSRFKAIFAGVPEHRLTYDDLIGMYKGFHAALHDENPYRAAAVERSLEDILAKLATDITKLRKFTWVHFIGIKGQAFAVDLKNTQGVTAVIPMSKISEIPVDLR